MEKFWIEFNEIFKQHGDAAARSGKRISFGTHHIRRGYLRRDFHLLRGGGLLRLEHGQVVRERRFKLGSPYNLKAKHIRALIDDWLARRHSRSYLENKLSVWRQFCTWIDKPNLVPGTAEVMSYPNYRHRSQVAVIDKTWSGRGIDVPGKLREIASSDARVALILELMLTFSLRLKEASLLRPHAADQGAYLDICRGTKGRRRRVHPIATAEEREVIERAKALVADRTACLVPRDKTYKQWQNHVYYVLSRHGISHKQIGTSTHGLRHQGLNRLYEQITGARSPVRGGRPGEVDRATDRFARQQVAETAGHGKRSVSSAYLGGVLHGRQPSVAIPNPPSAPDDGEKGEDESDDEDEDYDDYLRRLIATLRDRISSDEELS
ncbi:MAG: hypothetical protein ACYC1T_13955 [Sulfuricaulis sp.]